LLTAGTEIFNLRAIDDMEEIFYYVDDYYDYEYEIEEIK